MLHMEYGFFPHVELFRKDLSCGYINEEGCLLVNIHTAFVKFR